jgi:hypothetical protein
LMANYSRNEEGRGLQRALLETERERGLRGSDDRWGPHGGEREGGERVSWVGLVRGRSGPAGSRVRPKWAAGFFLLFFSFCFLFLLFLISVLGF